MFHLSEEDRVFFLTPAVTSRGKNHLISRSESKTNKRVTSQMLNYSFKLESVELSVEETRTAGTQLLGNGRERLKPHHSGCVSSTFHYTQTHTHSCGVMTVGK